MDEQRHAGFRIRRIRADDWRDYRDARLRALADTPDAFRTLLSEAAEQPDSYWQARAASGADDPANATFGAIAEDGRWIGMATGFIDQESATADVFGMWIDPAARRRGLGKELLGAVDRWAGSRGIRRLRLSVTETNTAARTLYAAAGFVETGRTEELREGSTLRVFEMIREPADDG
jgi:RimJ/RimL family protein N-acetyltransferase